MSDESGWTTLAVPKDFRTELKHEFDGRNDYERLKNWAENYNKVIEEDRLEWPDDLNKILEEIEEIKRRLSENTTLSKRDVDEVISQYV